MVAVDRGGPAQADGSHWPARCLLQPVQVTLSAMLVGWMLLSLFWLGCHLKPRLGALWVNWQPLQLLVQGLPVVWVLVLRSILVAQVLL